MAGERRRPPLDEAQLLAERGEEPEPAQVVLESRAADDAARFASGGDTRDRCVECTTCDPARETIGKHFRFGVSYSFSVYLDRDIRASRTSPPTNVRAHAYGHLPMLEVAYLLGFADQSTFQRACKRWFDISPMQYRNRSVEG